MLSINHYSHHYFSADSVASTTWAHPSLPAVAGHHDHAKASDRQTCPMSAGMRARASLGDIGQREQRALAGV
ncbi:MAG: hypothetical protein WCP70_11360 [Methanothrix sp.]